MYANQTGYQDQYTVVTFSVSTAMKVTAVQVNGYIFESASSTSTPSSTLSNTLSGSISRATSTLSSELSQTDGNSTISTGTVVGVAVGAAILGIIASLAFGWFILRRYRRDAFVGSQNFELHRGEGQPVFMKGSNPARSEITTVEVAQELYGNQTAHELHGSYGSRL